MSRRIPPPVSRARSDKMKPMKSLPKHTKKRRPVLARVMIENSSVPSQIAMVRPSETRKQSSTTHSRSSSALPKSHSESAPAASTLELSTLPPPYFPSDPLPKQPALLPSKPPRHEHSSNPLLKSRTASKHDLPIPLPFAGSSPLGDLMYSKANLTSMPSRSNIRESADPKPQRLRPDTFYSIGSARTGSTKLGEIPIQKWAEPWDYEAAERANEEALADGWPINQGRKLNTSRKGGWKRWFGKRAEAS